MCRLALLFLTLLRATASAAQSDPIAGWDAEARPGGATTYSHPSRNAVIVVSVRPLRAEEGGARINADALSEAIMAQMLGRTNPVGVRNAPPAASAGPSTPTPAPPRGPGASTQATDAAIRAAIAKVPAANRPRFLVDRWTYRMIGSNPIRTNTVWMAFDNGYATSCVDWNPATTAPIPANLRAHTDCGIAQWQRLADSTYRILDADGAKEDPIPASQWRPFAAGERVDVIFDNWDGRGGGTNAVSWYADVTIRDLVLHRDGTFGSAEQSESWWRGTRREQRRGVTGRYYVDGFLMAVQQRDGVVRLHFASYQLVNGQLRIIGFDGRQFTPK